MQITSRRASAIMFDYKHNFLTSKSLLPHKPKSFLISHYRQLCQSCSRLRYQYRIGVLLDLKIWHDIISLCLKRPFKCFSTTFGITIIIGFHFLLFFLCLFRRFYGSQWVFVWTKGRKWAKFKLEGKPLLLLFYCLFIGFLDVFN